MFGLHATVNLSETEFEFDVEHSQNLGCLGRCHQHGP